MTSLHWMLVLTLALLHFCTSAPGYRSDEGNFEILENAVKSLKNSSCAESDATFYSPKVSKKVSNQLHRKTVTMRIQNLKQCIAEALSCSAKELNTVKAECFDNAKESHELDLIRDIIEEQLSHNTLQAGGENCICEGSEKEDYKKFLDNILTLTERLNSSS